MQERKSGRVRVVVIYGTRPEAIKLAPVIAALRRHADVFDLLIWSTGQHREMLEPVTLFFGIEPDHDLRLMEPGQTLSDMTARALVGLERLFIREKPDFALVQGDSTTAFVAALAAFYAGVPVGHVEAGLRTGRSEPWPEEMNRLLIARLASIHFAATNRNRQDLEKEGVAADRIHVTGNPIIDSLFSTLERIRGDDAIASELVRRYSFLDSTRRLILVTSHRREHFGSALEALCSAISQLLERRGDIEIVYPVHLNPNVRDRVASFFRTERGEGHSRLHLLDPADYVSMIHLLERAAIVITDSGGLQEEAPALGKPVLLLRASTERMEGVEMGTTLIVGSKEADIVRETEHLLDDVGHYRRMSQRHLSFGDGKAGERIVQALRAELVKEA